MVLVLTCGTTASCLVSSSGYILRSNMPEQVWVWQSCKKSCFGMGGVSGLKAKWTRVLRSISHCQKVNKMHDDESRRIVLVEVSPPDAELAILALKRTGLVKD